MKALNIFIIYAREDVDALRELRVQFIPVAKNENLNVWYDGEILPGQHWDNEIKTQLQNADIVLLFISKYFFASNYIQNNELKQALARHNAGEVVIIPVIVRACAWQDAFEVSRFQSLPLGGQPIFSKHWHDVDEAMANVVDGVKRVIHLLKGHHEDDNLMKKKTDKISLSQIFYEPDVLKQLDFEIIEMKISILRNYVDLKFYESIKHNAHSDSTDRWAKSKIPPIEKEIEMLNSKLENLLVQKNNKAT
ncbi:MAG: toll/interleukin-1 receptor domain-containing protein [Saprospiraceae bacterium]|nr:toll/interleukin-1 receptor domain-containing protein [Saprospiraceae bacterium]